MGVFEDLNRPSGMDIGAMKAQEAPCKRDYEKIIVLANEKQAKTKTLISALENYLLPELRYDVRNNTFTLDSLIGRLHLEDLEYDLAIERLLQQQEAESGK